MSLLAKLYNITLTFKFLLPHWLFINKYLMEFLQRTPPKIQKLYKEMQEWKKHSRQWEWSSNWLPNNLGHWGCSPENWLSNEQWFSQNAALRHLTRPAFQGKIRGRENWKKKKRSQKAELLPYLILLLSWEARWQDVGQPRLTKTSWLWDSCWGRGLQIAPNCSPHEAAKAGHLTCTLFLHCCSWKW